MLPPTTTGMSKYCFLWSGIRLQQTQKFFSPSNYYQNQDKLQWNQGEKSRKKYSYEHCGSGIWLSQEHHCLARYKVFVLGKEKLGIKYNMVIPLITRSHHILQFRPSVLLLLAKKLILSCKAAQLPTGKRERISDFPPSTVRTRTLLVNCFWPQKIHQHSLKI